MTELKNTWQELKERSINFWFRFALRVMAWGLLMVYLIFVICVPLINNEKVNLNKTDGYLIIGSLALLLAIEAVKAAVTRFLENKV